MAPIYWIDGAVGFSETGGRCRCRISVLHLFSAIKNDFSRASKCQHSLRSDLLPSD